MTYLASENSSYATKNLTTSLSPSTSTFFACNISEGMCNTIPKGRKITKIPTPTPTPIAHKHRWKRGSQHSSQKLYNLRNKGTNFKSQAAQYLLVQRIYQKTHIMYIYNDAGKKLSMDGLIKGKHGDIWA